MFSVTPEDSANRIASKFRFDQVTRPTGKLNEYARLSILTEIQCRAPSPSTQVTVIVLTADQVRPVTDKDSRVRMLHVCNHVTITCTCVHDFV